MSGFSGDTIIESGLSPVDTQIIEIDIEHFSYGMCAVNTPKDRFSANGIIKYTRLYAAGRHDESIHVPFWGRICHLSSVEIQAKVGTLADIKQPAATVLQFLASHPDGHLIIH